MNFPLYNDTLCPAVWDKKDSVFEMKSDVRSALLIIANDFIKNNFKENDLSLTIKDVILIGSIANYNWTKFSDFDLHILVDLNELEMDKAAAKLLVDGLKSAWNQNHEVTVKSHRVELYVQDIEEEAESSAMFSVARDVWIKVPKKEKPTFDKKYIQRKHGQLKDKIESVLKNPTETSLESILDRLYEMRQAGLDKKGEFSEENIVFKILRSQGYLEKLKKAVDALYDVNASLDEVEKLDDGLALDKERYFKDNKDTVLQMVPDREDKLIPVNYLNISKMTRSIPMLGQNITVFAGYEVSPNISKAMGADWKSNGKNLSDYLTMFRKTIKHPTTAENIKLVDSWVVDAVRRFGVDVPYTDKIEVIIPIGSKSELNMKIAEQIKKTLCPNAVISASIKKLTWKDVKLSPLYYAEKDNVATDGGPAKGPILAANALAQKQRLHPDEPFEIKKFGRQGWRRYVSDFYGSDDPEVVTGKNVLLIDDTHEEGATLRDAVREVLQSSPKKVQAFIFLYS